MTSFDTMSFQDLLRGLALKYEQARSNSEICEERVHWDLPAQAVKHHDQIIWQGWENNREESMTDPFYDQPKPAIESIPKVNISKTSPASSWQKSQMTNGSIPESPIMPSTPQQSPSGRQDGCRVSSPVAALEAPPQETVEIGIDEADNSVPASNYDTRPSERQSTFTAKTSLPTVTIEPDGAKIRREKEEKRIRRQFKRLTKTGIKRGEVRRLFPRHLHDVVSQVNGHMHEGRVFDVEVPSIEQVAKAMWEFITKSYSGERLTRILASRPSLNTAVSNSSIGDVCLDLPTFFDLLTKSHDCGISEESTSVISCLRSACLIESKENNDTDSNGDSQNGSSMDVLKTNDNRLDTLSATVILLNAVVIGVSTDIDSEGTQWEVLEIIFTIYFVGEMCYKLKMMGCKIYFLGNDWHWNTFDAIVVAIAIFDLSFTNIVRLTSPDGGDNANLGSFTIIKMARLGRLARLVRLLRFKIFRELKAMIQGVIAGLRVLLWAVVLLFSFIYLLGIVLRKTMGESDLHHYAVKDSFESVPRAMLTLFRCFTDGCVAYDGTPLQVHLFNYYGAAFMFAYMFTFLFVTMGIFNLIMAIFIDNVMDSSLHRKMQERGANSASMEVSLKELIAELVSRSHKRRRSDFLSQAGKAMSKVEARVSHILDLDDPQTSLIRRKTVVDRDLAAMNAEKVTINRDTFESWLAEPDFLTMLEDLDIGTSNKSELFDVLDCDLSGELEVAEVISGLMKLRGPSDKSDAVAALLGIRYMTSRIDEMARVICDDGARLTFREELSDQSSNQTPEAPVLMPLLDKP